jgi:hypothetical protein
VTISSDLPSSVKMVEATEDNGNMEPIRDSDGDRVPGHIDAKSDGGNISPASQAVLHEMLSGDADGNGILDFLNESGGESQIGQMYDKDFERKQEKVRSFVSLMSMLGNAQLAIPRTFVQCTLSKAGYQKGNRNIQ